MHFKNWLNGFPPLSDDKRICVKERELKEVFRVLIKHLGNSYCYYY